jgi:hypothetical protein
MSLNIYIDTPISKDAVQALLNKARNEDVVINTSEFLLIKWVDLLKTEQDKVIFHVGESQASKLVDLPSNPVVDAGVEIYEADLDKIFNLMRSTNTLEKLC